MTVKEFAAMLNGHEYGLEVSKAESDLAKENGLVIVYGYSDDNMEFEGALEEEVGCFGGGAAFVTKSHVYQEAEDLPFDAKLIRAHWCAHKEAAWTYETEIPHEEFRIYEDGQLFCVGIVFSVDDI